MTDQKRSRSLAQSLPSIPGHSICIAVSSMRDRVKSAYRNTDDPVVNPQRE